MVPAPIHTLTACPRIIKYPLVSAFLIFYILGPSMTLADEVILTTGERFTSSKVWIEADKIRFNMHGLVVSVKKSDVATLIDGKGGLQHFAAPTYEDPPAASLGSTNPVTKPDHLPEKQPSSPADTPRIQPQKRTRPTPAPTDSKQVKQERIPWLIRPADIEGLVKIKKEPLYGGIDQYYRPNENNLLGQALLDGKVYGFWNNQLYSVMMWAEGRTGYKRLRDAVFSRYGKGHKSTKIVDRYIWMDATTDRMLEFDDERNTGFFWMRSRQLDAEIKKRYPNG